MALLGKSFPGERSGTGAGAGGRRPVSARPVLPVMGTEVLCKLAFIQKMRSLSGL